MTCRDVYGQKVAAEADAGFLSVFREIVWAAATEDECVGTDPSVLGRFVSGEEEQTNRKTRGMAGGR